MEEEFAKCSVEIIDVKSQLGTCIFPRDGIAIQVDG